MFVIPLLLAACGGGLRPVDSDADTGTDADVDTGSDVDTGTDPDTSDCDDDRNEDDDTVEDANRLTLPTTEVGTICPGDPDTFEITTRRSCEVTATLTYSVDQGVLDLLFYEDGFASSGSFSGSGTEVIGWIADADDTWHVQVEGRSGVTNEYTLAVTEDCTNACTDDTHEDHDSHGDAQFWTPGVIHQATACAGDDDWYRINTSGGCIVTVDVNGPIGSQLQTALFDADERLVVNGIDPGTSGSQARAMLGNGGAYLRVSSTADSTYVMDGTVRCSTGAGSCPVDDAMESNDQRNRAMPMAWGVFAGGAMCDDDDWFRLEGAPGCTATIDLNFNHNTGNLDMELTNSSGGRMQLASSTTSNEQIVATLQSGEVYVRVFGASEVTNGYVLRPQLSCQ